MKNVMKIGGQQAVIAYDPDIETQPVSVVQNEIFFSLSGAIVKKRGCMYHHSTVAIDL